MKKIYLAISYLLIANILFAQVPQGFSYQAVIRNSSGTPIANQNVSLKITLQSSSGSAYFSESKSITTNAQGVLNHLVGSGTLISGDISTIPWSSGDVYLKVEVDPEGGTAYVQMGDPARLLSVPYALYAASGNQGAPGVDGNGISGVVDNGDGTLTFTFTDGSSYKTPNLKGDKGEKGDAGTGLNNRGNWLTGTTYNPGDYVFATNTGQTGNSMWIVQAAAAFTSNIEPRLDPTNWVEFQAPKGDTGDKGENGISILWLGSFPDIPHSYSLNNAYYNSTEKKSFVYTAAGWQQMTQDGFIISGVTGQTLYYNGTAWTTSSNLYNNNINVGIGTTSPTQKLDVNGGIRLRSSIYDASNSSGSLNQLLVNNGSGAIWQSTSASGITSGTGTAGQVALWSGNNSIQGISNLTWGTTSLQIASPTSAGTDDPILEVKNKDGKVVLGVYQGGVRIYVDDSQITKGVRGGFAVGGLTNQSKGQQEYFRITPDSARIYVKEVPTTKGARGGFAIGGLTNQSKTVVNRNLMFVAPDSTRFWVNEAVAKGVRGGFAIGGLTNQGKGASSNFMQLTPENYFIGHQSGLNTSTGLYNSFLGYQAGMANTVGSNNSFIGYKSGLSNTLGDDNVFLGNESGYSNTEGKGNVFAGFTSGYSNTIGRNNVFIGNESGKNNTEGANNVFIGTSSGYNNIVGGNNTFLGYQTGLTNNASFNSFIGYRAGRTNSTGEKNTFMGYNAGYGNISGSSNVFIGNQSGYTNSTGEYNTFLGYNAGYTNNASYNSFLGYQAGKANTSGQYNSFMGYNAGLANTTGSSNVFVGHQSGAGNTSGANNVFIGTSAGYSSNGNYNIAIGNNAGYSLTTGNVNVLIGESAGKNHTTQEYNVMIGQNAGYNLQGGGMWDGSFNTFMGINAGYKIATGKENVFIGTNAGYFIENGFGNSIVGIDAGRSGEEHNNGYDASFNTFFGDKAAYNITEGDNNVVIGYLAGFSLTSGSGNVLIGNNAGYREIGSNKLWIANSTTLSPTAPAPPLIYGDFSLGRIGLGTLTPSYKLDVVGDINITGDFRVNGSPISTTTLTTGLLSATSPISLSNTTRLLVGGAATISISDASTTVKGAVMLSDSYNGTSQVKATTEKALKDGLSTKVSSTDLSNGLATKVTGAGFTMGKIFLSAPGNIVSTSMDFELALQVVKGALLLVITNTNKDNTPCFYWYQSQDGNISVGNSGQVDVGSPLELACTDGQGIEIHFGDNLGNTTCSVWIQNAKGVLIGHYTIYGLK